MVQQLCDATVFNLVIKLINSQVVCGEVLVRTEIPGGGRYWWGRRSQEVGGTGGDGDPKRWEVLVGAEIPGGGRYWWGRRSQEVGGTGGDGDPKRWEVLVGTEIPGGGDGDPIPDATLPSPE